VFSQGVTELYPSHSLETRLPFVNGLRAQPALRVSVLRCRARSLASIAQPDYKA
jgi:hypothetical protein